MGTAALALIAAGAAGLALAAPRAAHACTGVTPSGGRFATCFDPGTRLSLTAGSDGIGGAAALRHVIHFADEPDLVWKLEHVATDATYSLWDHRFTGTLYRGRYLRHARDGHIVLPLGTPRKVFLPFDIGALAEVGSLRWRSDDTTATLGVIKTAALIDLARSRTFRRRFAIGPAARWDVQLTRDPLTISQHIVAPFTTALANLHLESATGRLTADLRLEAGTAWNATTGWHPEAAAAATLERIVLAINDRPIALLLGARYDTTTDEALAHIGARIVLAQRRDPRVSLAPPRSRTLPARISRHELDTSQAPR